MSPGRGWCVLHCKQSQPLLETHPTESFVFNLSLNLLELMMARHSNEGALPPNSGWIFNYDSLSKGKTKPEGKSLLTFPVPMSSSSPQQALSPLTRTSHTFFFPGKEKLLTENVPSHSSVNAISALSSQGEAEQRGQHLISHSLHETQLCCISQQIFYAGKEQKLDHTCCFLNKLTIASAGVSVLTPWFKLPTSQR